MKLYLGVTDQDWFDFLRSQQEIDEVNFWQPSPSSDFRALEQGDLFLFKLHRSVRTGNRDVIAGGGVFVSFSVLPISLAWEAFDVRQWGNFLFGHAPATPSLQENPRYAQRGFPCRLYCSDPTVLSWRFDVVPAPEWSPSIVRGKATGYELDKEAGQSIWQSLQNAWRIQRVTDLSQEARRIEEESARYGKEATFRPRLGQGSFRVLVTDAYQRSCAISEEHSLPALEASHIKPYNENGPHAVHNGLLLRSDLHRLFDRGYITVTADYHIEVSRRLKDEFKNGKSYYPFHGQPLSHFPANRQDHPDKDLLLWHNEHVYKG